MKRVGIAALTAAVTMVAAFATPAVAKVPSLGNPCPAPNLTFTVNAGNAALVANGFDCKQVNLDVTATISPTVESLVLVAKTIAVGAVSIVNNLNSGSDVFLTAEGGGIAIAGATIRANDIIKLECKSLLCTITISNSVISAPINPLLTSGDVRADAHGNVSINNNSTFFGKNKVGVFSSAGSVLWHCRGDTPARQCTDPALSGVAQALCPGGFPCQPTFASLAALTSVCLQAAASPPVCGGGENECQINALLDVDLHDSNLVCNSHFGVTSKQGNIFLSGANIVAKDALTFQAYKGVFAPNANLTSLFGAVTLETKGGIANGLLCIDVKGADITKPRFFLTSNACTVATLGLTPP